MRVTLIHNPTAGEEDYSCEELVAILEKAGHSVRYRSSKDDYRPALKKQADLVVAAGGDGTVAKVAKRLLGRRVPLAILPIGTANNIASSLGIRGSPRTLVAGWDSARQVRFQAGTVTGPKKVRPFFESVGFGLFAELMLRAEEDEADSLEDHVRRIFDMAKRHHPRRWRVEADGKDISGRYLLLEAMNIRSIGPNLHLAPRADPEDRYLELVTVTEDHRAELLEYLRRRLRRHTKATDLPIQRIRSLRLECEGRPFHIDDKLFIKHGQMDVRMNAGSLPMLVR